MAESLYLVVGFVLLLALVPWGVKWMQSRAGAGSLLAGASSRVLSAVAVGPQQRVVTVEVGTADARVCLVLGVTQQSISCLHAFPAASPGDSMGPLPATVSSAVAGKGL